MAQGKKQEASVYFNLTNDILSLHILDSCKSKKVPGRIECGWPTITKQQCLALNCCYDNNRHDYNAFDNRVTCFVKPHLGEYTLREIVGNILHLMQLWKRYVLRVFFSECFHMPVLYKTPLVEMP